MKRWLLVSARELSTGVSAAVAAAYAGNTLYVNAATGADSASCGASTSPCRTIQKAVDHASLSGDTIQVAAGIYDEPGITVDKSVTLLGAQADNAGSAARASESPTTESVLVGGTLSVGASDVTVDGFSFGYAALPPQVDVYSPAATIEDNVFSGYATGPANLVTAAIGVNAAPNTTIADNYFTSPAVDYRDVGGAVVQWFNGGCSGADVRDNTFEAADQSALAEVFFCDGYEGQATSQIRVTGNRDSDVGHSSFAVFEDTGGGGTIDVTDNVVTMTSASRSGIYFWDDPGVGAFDISGNTIHGNPYRAVNVAGDDGLPNEAATGPFTITGNDLSGNAVGVYFDAVSIANKATLRGNNLSGETGDSGGDGPDGVYVDPNYGGSIDAADNWWGCNAGPDQPGCSAVSGDVTFDSSLVLGISASPSALQAGGSSTITADVTHDSAGNDASASGTIPDGTSIAFATDFGTLSANSAGTSGGKASVTLTSSAPGTANVSATLDSQTVSTAVTFKPNTPTTIDQCKKGGWQTFGIFKNQGDCVSYVATQGKNPPNGH